MTDRENQIEISVVIPVYNVERYVERCLKSVLTQNFPFYEMIIVDDGSTDNSGKICDQYANSYKRISVIHKENGGLAQARKTGLQYCRGNYVIFLDSDDWIERDTLESLFKTAIKYRSDFISFQYQRVDDDEKVSYDVVMKESIIECNDINKVIYHMVKTRYLNASACTKMVRRKLLEQVKFKQNLAIGEEHDMLVQLVQIASKIIILPNAYYNYYCRNGSISTGGYNKKYYNSFKNYERMRLEVQKLSKPYSSDINAFFHEYEMAMITAMCRNKKIDKSAVQELRNVMKENLYDIMRCRSMKIVYKCSAILIVFCPDVFIKSYGKLYDWGKV